MRGCCGPKRKVWCLGMIHWVAMGLVMVSWASGKVQITEGKTNSHLNPPRAYSAESFASFSCRFVLSEFLFVLSLEGNFSA